MNSETLKYIEVVCKYFVSESVSQIVKEFKKFLV